MRWTKIKEVENSKKKEDLTLFDLVHQSNNNNNTNNNNNNNLAMLNINNITNEVSSKSHPNS
jgi:hypothetical protein